MAKDIRPPSAPAHGTQMAAAVSATEKCTIGQIIWLLLHYPNNYLFNAKVHSKTELVTNFSVERTNSRLSLHRSLDTD